MVSTDPIADMFTRIRNAILVNKPVVTLPHSKAKERVARILVEKGFLNSVTVKDGGYIKQIQITIYPEGSNAKISEISRLSTPGRRMYVKTDNIPKIKRGRGIVIISTSKGVMTGDEATAKRLGGELIGKVY